jgi:hypothetical protein
VPPLAITQPLKEAVRNQPGKRFRMTTRKWRRYPPALYAAQQYVWHGARPDAQKVIDAANKAVADAQQAFQAQFDITSQDNSAFAAIQRQSLASINAVGQDGQPQKRGPGDLSQFAIAEAIRATV